MSRKLDRGRAGPSVQCRRIAWGGRAGSERRPVLVKMDPATKFGDRALSRQNLGIVRRTEQPAGQGRPAHAGASSAQEFKERTHAEHVKIGRVDVALRLEFFTGNPESLPFASHALEPAM